MGNDEEAAKQTQSAIARQRSQSASQVALYAQLNARTEASKDAAAARLQLAAARRLEAMERAQHMQRQATAARRIQRSQRSVVKRRSERESASRESATGDAGVSAAPLVLTEEPPPGTTHEGASAESALPVPHAPPAAGQESPTGAEVKERPPITPPPQLGLFDGLVQLSKRIMGENDGEASNSLVADPAVAALPSHGERPQEARTPKGRTEDSAARTLQKAERHRSKRKAAANTNSEKANSRDGARDASAESAKPESATPVQGNDGRAPRRGFFSRVLWGGGNGDGPSLVVVKH